MHWRRGNDFDVCPTLDFDAIPLAAHEAAVRLAIAAAKANPFYPFGAVIIGAADRAVLAQGVNSGKTNPILHGEIVAINDYARAPRQPRLGRRQPIHYRRTLPDVHGRHCLGWHRRVVYGSSITTLAEVGIPQIMVDESVVRDAAPFYRGRIMGGVLRAETDALFRNRQRG